QAVPGGRRPRAVFVWGGRDAVERVQRDSEALARGEVHAVGRGGPASREVEQLLAGALPGDVDAAGARAGAAEAQPCPPLIAQAAAAQVYAVNDVLHEGPAPSWYCPAVAKVGVKAIKAQSMRRANFRSRPR
ncbi:unnamed protein product, partial [Prorocentrum cordatum]